MLSIREVRDSAITATAVVWIVINLFPSVTGYLEAMKDIAYWETLEANEHPFEMGE